MLSSDSLLNKIGINKVHRRLLVSPHSSGQDQSWTARNRSDSGRFS